MKISIMKTNKWILGGLMAMAITACTSDELVENTNPTQGKKVTVTAYAPGDEANSRVSFIDDDEVEKVFLSWEDSESFSVVYHTTVQTFSKTTAGNTFTGILPTPATSPASYYAVYPALEEEATLTAANTVPFDLSEQTGTLNESKTYMYASSSDGLSFQFNHLTAILKVSFSGLPDGATVKELVVTTPDASKVDGTIGFTETGEAGSKVVNASITGGTKNTIIIDYANKRFNNPVYIYLPPMDKANKTLNFSVTVNDSNEDEKIYTAILEGNPESPIEAGSLYNVGVIQLEEDNNPYFSFTNNMGSPKTFTLKKQGTLNANLQYSLNGGGWLTWSTGVDVPNQGVLRLRGANKNGENYIGTAVDSRNYLYIYPNSG